MDIILPQDTVDATDNYLYSLSIKHAPYMPDSYHLEFVRIVKDMIRICAIKEKGRA